MDEYIVKESGYPGRLETEIVSELIRCKECRHWREQALCGIWDQYISNEDFYCGCAEREEGETNVNADA